MSVILGRRGFLQGTALLAALGVLEGPTALALGTGRGGDLIGEITHYRTRRDETLLDIARAHNLGVPEISAVNPGVDPWVPGEDVVVTLPTAFILPDGPREGIVVNYAELRLYFFPGNSAPVQTYAIGIGRDGFELMMGQTRITRKKERPTWYPTADTQRDKPWVGKVVPPGPDNPLGEFALYLGWPTYLIHGTNKPYGVGRRVSRGCIRMYPEGVRRLFVQAGPNTKVTAVNQPVKIGWHEGELYIEVQPDFDQLDELEASQIMSIKPPPDVRQQLIGRAGPDARRIDWVLVEAELASRRGIPVAITRSEADMPVAEAPAAAAPVLTAMPAAVVDVAGDGALSVDGKAAAGAIGRSGIIY